MRVLSTAALLSACGAANADNSTARHPVIGDKAANVITNDDILALPEIQQQAWIHGAVTLMAQTAAGQEGNAAHCIMDWYFDYPQTHVRIVKTMEKYPGSRAASTMYGLAQISCKSL